MSLIFVSISKVSSKVCLLGSNFLLSDNPILNLRAQNKSELVRQKHDKVYGYKNELIRLEGIYKVYDLGQH